MYQFSVTVFLFIMLIVCSDDQKNDKQRYDDSKTTLQISPKLEFKHSHIISSLSPDKTVSVTQPGLILSDISSLSINQKEEPKSLLLPKINTSCNDDGKTVIQSSFPSLSRMVSDLGVQSSTTEPIPLGTSYSTLFSQFIEDFCQPGFMEIDMKSWQSVFTHQLNHDFNKLLLCWKSFSHDIEHLLRDLVEMLLAQEAFRWVIRKSDEFRRKNRYFGDQSDAIIEEFIKKPLAQFMYLISDECELKELFSYNLDKDRVLSSGREIYLWIRLMLDREKEPPERALAQWRAKRKKLMNKPDTEVMVNRHHQKVKRHECSCKDKRKCTACHSYPVTELFRQVQKSILFNHRFCVIFITYDGSCILDVYFYQLQEGEEDEDKQPMSPIKEAQKE